MFGIATWDILQTRPFVPLRSGSKYARHRRTPILSIRCPDLLCCSRTGPCRYELVFGKGRAVSCRTAKMATRLVSFYAPTRSSEYVSWGNHGRVVLVETPTHRKNLVGARGFEPPTPCSRSKCATRLRHAPPDHFCPFGNAAFWPIKAIGEKPQKRGTMDAAPPMNELIATDVALCKRDGEKDGCVMKSRQPLPCAGQACCAHRTAHTVVAGLPHVGISATSRTSFQAP